MRLSPPPALHRIAGQVLTPPSIEIFLGALAIAVVEAVAQCWDHQRLVQGLKGAALSLCAWKRTKRLGKFFVTSFALLRLSSKSLRLVAPRTHRELRAHARVSPVLASYVFAKKRIRRLPLAKRDAAWDRQHEWAAERGRRVVEEFGGFYVKLGQVTGTAAHLMPKEWVTALKDTMDKNDAVSFDFIQRKIQKAFPQGMATFDSFDPEPVATASIAQVHKAVWRGTKVAVKVNLGRKKMIMSDVKAMRQQSVRAKMIGLDAGLDMPSIMQAYEDIVPEEFDFLLEADKLRRFLETVRRNGLDHLVKVPRPLLATSDVLILEWLEGTKLTELFTNDDASFFAQRGTTAEKFFHALHCAYGAMLFDPEGEHEFHSDCHPGNVMICQDGKVGLLDFGQTKAFSKRLALGCAEICVAMSSGVTTAVAEAIENLNEFNLVGASPRSWALVAYTFFDTRWTPLADVNVYDLDRSVLAKGGLTKNSADAFPLMRVAILMRGMMTRAGLKDVSMIDAWEPYARKYLYSEGNLLKRRRLPMISFRRSKRRLTALAYNIIPDTWLSVLLYGDTNATDYLHNLRSLQKQALKDPNYDPLTSGV